MYLDNHQVGQLTKWGFHRLQCRQLQLEKGHREQRGESIANRQRKESYF